MPVLSPQAGVQCGMGDTPAEAVTPEEAPAQEERHFCFALNPPRVSHFPSPGQSRPSPCRAFCKHTHTHMYFWKKGKNSKRTSARLKMK